ncbi:MAG: hypothetical protein HQ568_10915 [Calditrichaeota bacterium]|nr:hypothetical protein [Calditrichota bacterium]
MIRKQKIKSVLSIGILLIVQLFLMSCTATMSQKGFIPRMHALGPDSTLSISRFDIKGPPKNKMAPGLGAGAGLAGAVVGTVIDVTKEVIDKAGKPYFEQLKDEIIGLYEETLIGSGSFSYVPKEKLVLRKDGKPMYTDGIIEENDLNACITVTSSMGACFGMKKKVRVSSLWKIEGRGGWMVKIGTDAISNETYGVFPGPSDPKLKPIFLKLAQENVYQFLVKLDEMGILIRP